MTLLDDKPHILVVDDDDRLRTLLKKFLSEQGFMVTAVESAASARAKMAWFEFDVLVLDVMMPGETGLSFLASLKKEGEVGRRAPVLMLSAMGEAEDRIKGLEFGADDYLPKPFEPKELVLRIKTILRRAAPASKSVAFGDYIFDIAASSLKRGGEFIALTSNESLMLKLLAERAGTPVSREELARLMPGNSSERAVDVQVTRLRKKFGEEGKSLHLQTVRGAGYVLYASAAGAEGK